MFNMYVPKGEKRDVTNYRREVTGHDRYSMGHSLLSSKPKLKRRSRSSHRRASLIASAAPIHSSTNSVKSRSAQRSKERPSLEPPADLCSHSTNVAMHSHNKTCNTCTHTVSKDSDAREDVWMGINACHRREKQDQKEAHDSPKHGTRSKRSAISQKAWTHAVTSGLEAMVNFFSCMSIHSVTNSYLENVHRKHRRRFMTRQKLTSTESDEELGHDRFNYMNPKVNYDKWPRRIRPKRNLLRTELEAPETLPHLYRNQKCNHWGRCSASSGSGAWKSHSKKCSAGADAASLSGSSECSHKSRNKYDANSTLSEDQGSLNKVFACLGVEDHYHPSFNSSSHKSRSHQLALPGRKNNCDYNTVQGQENFDLELERRSPGDVREMAARLCRQYIRCSGRYTLLDQLQDIGSRIDKQWFMVRDTVLKTERLLTLVPQNPTGYTPLAFTSNTQDAVLDLFAALQHPYIYPILDLDFLPGIPLYGSGCESARPVLVTVFPFNGKGSLKDLIYRSRWQDDWSQKYRQRSEGLPFLQVQRLGRQILEALLFLQERGFPPFGHLHSGNIIIQNGVARLTGFENTLLGYTSRVYPIIKNLLDGDVSALDSVCFGHVLFEMCAGYELYTPRPSHRHMEDIKNYPQVVEVLDFIFNHPSGKFPSIKTLTLLDFFRNIDLREMRCPSIKNFFYPKLSLASTTLLEQVRSYSTSERRRSRSETLLELAGESDESLESICTDVSTVDGNGVQENVSKKNGHHTSTSASATPASSAVTPATIGSPRATHSPSLASSYSTPVVSLTSLLLQDMVPSSTTEVPLQVDDHELPYYPHPSSKPAEAFHTPLQSPSETLSVEVAFAAASSSAKQTARTTPASPDPPLLVITSPENSETVVIHS